MDLRKNIRLIAVTMAVFIMTAGVLTGCAKPGSQAYLYDKAVKALKDDRALTAYSLFRRCGEYKDSVKQADALRYVLYYHPISEQDQTYLTKDGKIKFIEDEVNKTRYAYSHVKNWSGIAALSRGSLFSDIAVKTDGTVAMFAKLGAYEGWEGDLTEILPQVAGWTDIVQLETFNVNGIIGLRKDGTVALPENITSYGEKLDPLKYWADIIQLKVIGMDIVGLKRDGTLSVLHRANNSYLDLESASGLIMLSEDYGLKNDGTVIKLNKVNEKPVPESWKDIAAIFSGGFAMDYEGTLIDTYGNRYDPGKETVFVYNYGNKALCVLNDGSTYVLDKKSGVNTAFKGTMINNMTGLNDLAVPKNFLAGTFMSNDDAVKRFDPAKYTIHTERVYGYLDNKYNMIDRMYGTDDCGYLNNKYGLSDGSGNILIEPEWNYVYPINDDRFVINQRINNAMGDPGNNKFWVVDRSGKKVSAETFNEIIYTYQDRVQNFGIGRIFSGGSKPNAYYLLDHDGNKIDGTAWDDLKFTPDGIEGTLNESVYKLGPDGKPQ